ncbi:MAG: uracil-DNA glycosylase, partial [Acetobacteraceae bacterium]
MDVAERDALLGLLRLQAEWGADECLADHPADRFAAPPEALPPRVAEDRVPPVRPRAAAPDAPPRPGLPIAPDASRAASLAQAADSLDALRAAIAGFDGSPLRDT